MHIYIYIHIHTYIYIFSLNHKHHNNNDNNLQPTVVKNTYTEQDTKGQTKRFVWNHWEKHSPEKQDKWKNHVKVSTKLIHVMSPQTLVVQNFGLWLMRKLRQRHHTWLAQHPNPSLVPVFHTLSKSQTALGKGRFRFQPISPGNPLPEGPNPQDGKKKSQWLENILRKTKEKQNREQKLKEDKHSICIGPRSFKPEGTLEMIPTTHSGAPLGQLYHFRTNTTHSYRWLRERLAQDHPSGSKDSRRLEAWQKELTQKRAVLVSEVQIRL